MTTNTRWGGLPFIPKYHNQPPFQADSPQDTRGTGHLQAKNFECGYCFGVCFIIAFEYRSDIETQHIA